MAPKSLFAGDGNEIFTITVTAGNSATPVVPSGRRVARMFSFSRAPSAAEGLSNGAPANPVRLSGVTLAASPGTATFTIIAPITTPDYTGITQPALVYTEGTALATPTELPAAVGGTGTVSYTLAPNLPAGLTFTDANPPTISGNPTATLAETEFTLTATDSASTPATADLMFNITVNAAPPLTYTGITQPALVFTEGTALATPTELPAAVGGIGTVSYALAPNLPAGLTFTDANPPTISGNPTATLAETEFTLTATDSASTPATAELMFNITVNAAPPPTFGGQSIAAQRYTLNEDIGTITLPEATGGIGTVSYALAPNPPAGLTFTAATRRITGIPTATFAETPFTFTATDSASTPATATLMFTITVREVTVEPEEVKTEVETVATLIGSAQVGTISGLIRTRFSGVAGPPSVGGAALAPTNTAGGATTSLTLPDNPQDMGDMLDGLALEHTTGADGGGAYAVWVRGQYSSMEGDPTVNGITVDYDGDSTGIGGGVEKSTGRYVAGVAVNWLATDLDLASSSTSTTISNYEESLVMVAPYLSLRRGSRTFWLSAGYGIGETDAALEMNQGKASADVQVTFANAGADFVLNERGKNRLVGGVSVLGVRKVVDSLNFAAAKVIIPEITLNTFRGRGEVTYYRTVEAGDGRVVRPYIGIATLHDAGDKINDDSHALDLRGGVNFDGARFDVSLEASTELLREDHESWTVSGNARYQFAPGGMGASLALDGISGDASDIGLEGGYGMMMRQVHRDALLTPFAGIRHGSGGGEISSGMRFAIGGDMDADVKAVRRFSDDDTLKLTVRRTF